MNQVMAGGKDPADIWNKILRAALSMPGARIDRSDFLKKELSKRVPSAMIDLAVSGSPKDAGVSPITIDAIADSCISWHRSGVTAASAMAGLPGGWWMAGTIPADMTQFFWHVVVVLQKLVYLYGWPELFIDGEDLDDESLHVLTVFIGVMFGAAGATQLLGQLSEKISKEVAKRLPKYALTKWGLYKLAKEVAKWIGVQLTKETFARVISKAIPIIGALISGSITWVSYSSMSHRLKDHLARLHQHTAGN
jgi:hypothetical protein